VKRCIVFAAIALLGAWGCGENRETPGNEGYSIVREFPHDTGAYTQGLIYTDGVLYESTGLYGDSEVRRVELATGNVLQSRPMDSRHWGEGMALLNGKLYQLTWQNKRGYVYDAKTFAPIDSFTYEGEGWGLATDGTSLIMTDGTDEIRFIDPATFKEQKRVAVRADGSRLTALNELEWVNGELFANIYQSDKIVRIDPVTGVVKQWLDFSGLLPSERRTPSTDVLNGIAYDSSTGHLLITGKKWPAMFEIRLTSSSTEE
jgi:glutaminyl-peptide cyclotransferase